MTDLSGLSDEELTNQYQSLSDDDLKAAYDQSQPQQDLSSVSNDDLMQMYRGMSDDELKQAYSQAQPQAEGPIGTALREAAHGVLPLMGGVAAGAALGSVVPGPGTALGAVGGLAAGVAGMVGGSMLANKAQDYALKELGYNDDPQRQVNAEENPKSAFVGGLLPAVGNPAGTLAQRGAAALGGAAFEGGQQWLQDGQIDPAKALAAGAFFGAFPGGNPLTGAAHNFGAKAAGRVVGRPDIKPADPVSETEKADADINQSPSVAGNQATEQQPAAEPTTTNPEGQVAGTKVKAAGGEIASKRPVRDINESSMGVSPTDNPDQLSDPLLRAGVEGSIGNDQTIGNTGLVEAAKAQTPNPVAGRVAQLKSQIAAMPPNDRRAAPLIQEHNDLVQQLRAPKPAEAPPVEAAPTQPVAPPAPPPAAQVNAAKPKLTLPAKAAEAVKTSKIEPAPEALAPEAKPEIPPLDAKQALTLKRMKANGWEQLAPEYEQATPEKRAEMQPHIDANLPQETKHSVDRRVKDKARYTNDIGMESGPGEFDRHQSAIAAIRKAYAEHPPVEGETGADLVKRIQAAVNTAHEAHGDRNPLNRKLGYLPRNLPPEFEWFRHLQNQGERKPIYFDTNGKLAAFKAEENLYRSKLENPEAEAATPIIDPKKLDAAIEMSRRGGDVAETQLEKQSAANDPREAIDEMIDIKRNLEKMNKSPADIEEIMKHIETHEEETSARPTEVRIRKPKDIQKLEEPRKTLDLTSDKAEPLPPVVRKIDIADIKNDPAKMAEILARSEKAARSNALYSGLKYAKSFRDHLEDAGTKLIKLDKEKGGQSGQLDIGEIGHDLKKLFTGSTSIVTKAFRKYVDALRAEHPDAGPTGEKPPPPPKTVAPYLKQSDEPVRYIAKDISKDEPAIAGYDVGSELNKAGKTDNSISAESVRKRDRIKSMMLGDDKALGKRIVRKLSDAALNKADELRGTKTSTTQKEDLTARDKDLYKALESKDDSKVNETDQPILDQLKGLKADVDLFRAQIEAKIAAPKSKWKSVKIGRPTEDGVARRFENGGERPEETDMLGYNPDPIAGRSPLDTPRKSMARERTLVALEDKNGGRHIIQLDTDKDGDFNGKFSVWHKGENYDVKVKGEDPPPLNFKLFDDYKVGDRTFKMRDATTDELEANVRGNDGQFLRAQKSGVASVLSAHDYYAKLLNHMDTMDRIRDSAGWKKYTTEDAKLARQNGWKEVEAPGFEGTYAEDRLREALEDAVKPGINDGALDIARKLSRATQQTIFWNPVVHLLNVLPHWAVGRGARWASVPAYKNLFETGGQAIKTVLSNDPLHAKTRDILARHGYGAIYDGIVGQNSYNKVAVGLAETVARNPKNWSPIAQKLDMTVGDLVRSIYGASKHIMWSGNDMMLTQSILEHLREAGHNDINKAPDRAIEDAINSVEKHFPNYRIPSRVGGANGPVAGKVGRFISKGLGDVLFTGFGRYGYGMFNSHANIIKDIVKGGPDRTEAIGQLMVLGALAYVVHPLANMAARAVTGNPDAESRPRGPLTIPGHMANAARTGDFAPVIREGLRLSPLMTATFEAAQQKEFGGRAIASPAAVQRAFGHEGPAAVPGGIANVLLHDAGHIAQGLIAPISTVTSAVRNHGLAAGARDQLLDVDNKSDASRKFLNHADKKAQQEEKQRRKNPKNIADWITNQF